ncbi:3-deoxy-7-phosphoheptulonate synthase [Parasporobacterium paucivorans]|uniref:3-deoxy-D-arabinoheptulosonate-7-phosphate synthase n=1 Tax=Parasporobacterium paucivorans DSM 15970 TaxID=1122934 RepID=A0A1M6BYK6_9FIRM|nr:3-deoxy-7-phosphoheptulonate synthase [Parasporobacterium paucivorans]SHI53862.1 3-deoxy-D-arabinoheptulosonate-7-phosphate synthase [Parasporobacterium paucivorans DSM 15970]
MIILLKKHVTQEQETDFISQLKEMGFDTHLSIGTNHTIIGLVGDTSTIDIEMLKAFDIVETVQRVQEPFKKSNRRFHEEDTVITLQNGTKIGGGNFQVMAGPCSIESEEQIIGIAQSVKAAGASILRGGAFKPRTSPYSFQGLQEEGLELLLKAKEKTGLPIVTEIMDSAHIPLFEEVDIIQVGARNMQNFELLKKLGQLRKPVLLKRGLANTLQELLMSAEYIMAGGNEQVILCERGIRTIETYTRNTLDISAIPVLHRLSHLPVIADPSHATGDAKLVRPMALAAVMAGVDGLLIEVHNDPSHALCDGAQSLTPEAFASMMGKIQAVRPFAER